MTEILYDRHQVIVDNEFAILVYYPDQGMIHHTIRKPVAGDVFRSVMTEGADALEEHKAIKWLSDDRRNSMLPPDDMDWASANWRPRVISAGWKFWALVVPEEMLARFTMQRAVNTAFEEGLRIQAFSKLDEAKTWLEQQ